MKRLHVLFAFVLFAVIGLPSFADDYDDTIKMFMNAGQSANYFSSAYGYAVFPTIIRIGIGVGGARGSGRVFRQGMYVGDTTVTQGSIGLQLGGKGYSMIIFFQDERAFNEFTNGNFSFDAGVSAVAITASAGATAGTSGAHAGAAGGANNAVTAGGYQKGLAVFTIVKGGAMGAATVGGQKFSYTPRGQG
jgi:lipid-binding SYLF domain-containing protein